jgi:Holliday junction resolvase-like predicted endonuclease
VVVATVVGMVVVEVVGRPEGRAEPGRERPARLLGRAPTSIGSAANMFLANNPQLFSFNCSFEV